MLCSRKKASWLAYGWLLLLAALLTLAATQLHKFKPNSDILTLLPKTESAPLVKRAQQQLDQRWSGLSIWFAIADNSKQALIAAEQLKQQLDDSGLFASVDLQLSSQFNAEGYQRLFAARYHLLRDKDRQAIKQDGEQFMQQRVELLYSPLGMQYSRNLQSDPLFIFPHYFNQLVQQSDVDLSSGAAIFERNKQHYAMLLTKVKGLPFDQQLALAELHQTLSQQGDVIAAGLPLYTAYGASSAESEMTRVGVWSMVGVILLVLFCFRSVTPLFLALCSIATGVLAAVSFSLLYFGQIHLITLAFGSSLIGITIDYTFHYLCDRLRSDAGSSMDSLKAVLPGIALGVSSSMIAYGALLFTPFPALQEIGLFTVAGLLAAWLTVVLLYPRMIATAKLPQQVPVQGLLLAYLYRWPAFGIKHRKLLAVLLLSFIAYGLWQLESDDDIRNMQKPAADLAQQEEQVKAIGQQQQDSQYFIFSAASPEQLVMQEKHWLKQLDALQQQGVIQSYTALSQYFPSQQQQQQDWQLIKQQLFASGVVAEKLQSIGMTTEKIAAIEQEFQQSEAQTLSLEQWLAAVPEQWQTLYLGCEQGLCSSIVQLSGIQDKQALAKLKQLENQENVYFVDLVSDLNAILTTYRYVAMGFLALAFVLISVFLSMLLNVRKALSIVLVPLAALLASLATLSLLGFSVSMFHYFGLLLALGIGMDYAIFHNVGKHALTVALAVSCSLLTSLLAFGLLALSSTALIQAFGLSLALGISYAFILAPLFKTVQESK